MNKKCIFLLFFLLHCFCGYAQAGLFNAIEQNNLPKFKRQLAKYSKSEINKRRTADDLTPLLLACKKGYLPFVEFILKKKGSMSLKDGDGNTPLLLAMKHDHFKLVDYLVNKHGADIVRRLGE